MAIKNTEMSFNDLGIFNPQLIAYWDTSTLPYKERAPSGDRTATSSPDPKPYTIGEPIWNIDTVTMEQNWKSTAFIDLTDAVNKTDDFSLVTGILFRWKQMVNNLLVLPTPENSKIDRQPVWIVLKPFGGSEPDAVQAITDVAMGDPLLQRINLDFDDFPFDKACSILFKKGELDVTIETKNTSGATIKLNSLSVGEAIDAFLRLNGHALVKENESYRLIGRNIAEKEGLDTSMDFLSEYLLSKNSMHQLIDIKFDNYPLIKVLNELGQKSKANIIMGTQIDGTATCDLKQVELGRALEILLHANGLGIIKEGSVYRIAKEREATQSRDGDKYLFQ